ncbi:uncharacterized protein L969DRAFT_80444 [Mixia osmundae IAM 14324]|uniref:Uncharacterized protein n=1 Tax=Mixia osmundae (strain CBS 9802 / IAM 14324 / JCM 22182 / KY 12970) TaxID=764103 RepID=G7E4F8_MIXOS|nr:uncharacterized protein L969DRAFT_80444 [Mixia osmundae IAM 14324]KEI36265.1 hypothetical protein L969DRAFT_80444 [Mixia osmundae IAM 14324]GAA97718.1 hypothetical protein E5Q_04397 [Mixia osmundae IAM 14324]
MMSGLTTTDDARAPSPPCVEQLHHPEHAAHVEVPHGASNLPQGMSTMNGKAFLGKKMAASGQSFCSPTDTLVSPCTAKLNITKKKHFQKGKPLTLAASFMSNRETSQEQGNVKDSSVFGGGDENRPPQ